jgi:hypothetical protein
MEVCVKGRIDVLVYCGGVRTIFDGKRRFVR